MIVIQAILRGRMGRLLKGLADSPVALETHGATVNVMKVLVFCMTASMAAIAGALLASLYGYGLGTNYDSFSSLTMVAILMIVIMGDPWYAIVAAILYSVIPGYITVGNISTYLPSSSESRRHVRPTGEPCAVGPRPCTSRHRPMGGRAPELALTGEISTGTWQRPGHRGRDGAKRPRACRTHATSASAKSGLSVRELSVRYGGVQAVDNVSIDAPIGRITGLVGPNGAGKTTTFNACSGLLKPTAGKVSCMTARSPPWAPGRARLGLGRTFQKAELFNSLTVRENVELGRESSMAGANPSRSCPAAAATRRWIRRAVDEALELTGIGPLADLQAGLLPTGQRRLVELARGLAGPFELLLVGRAFGWARPRGDRRVRRRTQRGSGRARGGNTAGRARHGAGAPGVLPRLRPGLRPPGL